MTTREIYFKILIQSDLPTGRAGYVYMDKDGVIQIGSDICLELRTDEKMTKDSIYRMEQIEKTEGFMFWNNSPEGEEFFKENGSELGKCFAAMILNQE